MVKKIFCTLLFCIPAFAQKPNQVCEEFQCDQFVKKEAAQIRGALLEKMADFITKDCSIFALPNAYNGDCVRQNAKIYEQMLPIMKEAMGLSEASAVYIK